MYDSRIEFGIQNFIEEDYFLPFSDIYILREKSVDGKGILSLTVKNKNICVEDYDDKKRCNFLRVEKKFGMQKCIDHFILVEDHNKKWILYMIEMKTSVGNKTWMDIKHKMRASYLNIRANCVCLGIEIDRIESITTYENEKFPRATEIPDVKLLAPVLGEKAHNFYDDEWKRNIIRVKIDKDIDFPHTAIKMTRNDEGLLVGEYEIA